MLDQILKEKLDQYNNRREEFEANKPAELGVRCYLISIGVPIKIIKDLTYDECVILSHTAAVFRIKNDIQNCIKNLAIEEERHNKAMAHKASLYERLMNETS